MARREYGEAGRKMAEVGSTITIFEVAVVSTPGGDFRVTEFDETPSRG
jgi:hypothetical protein